METNRHEEIVLRATEMIAAKRISDAMSTDDGIYELKAKVARYGMQSFRNGSVEIADAKIQRMADICSRMIERAMECNNELSMYSEVLECRYMWNDGCLKPEHSEAIGNFYGAYLKSLTEMMDEKMITALCDLAVFLELEPKSPKWELKILPIVMQKVVKNQENDDTSEIAMAEKTAELMQLVLLENAYTK